MSGSGCTITVSGSNTLSFVGFDEVTGDIYRIEINPKITGRANHIRSIFKITARNYNDIKLEPPRVLQPSKTALQNGRAATMTISSFMKGNISLNPENASFELDRIRNIKTYIDVLTDPDFSYREEDKIIYGKKYNDIPHANGFISVVLNVTGDTIVPVSSSMDTFTKEKMNDKKITWFFMSTGESSELSGAPAGEISEEQSRGYRNISQNLENASNTDKNGPSAAPDGAMEGKRTETDKADGNAMFSLESAGSEELKLQVKAMQALVGNFLEQTGDGAVMALRKIVILLKYKDKKRDPGIGPLFLHFDRAISGDAVWLRDV